jgi:hypothetical protein
MGVLEADDSSSGFTPLGTSTFWEHEIKTDYSVSGARILNLEVATR